MPLKLEGRAVESTANVLTGQFQNQINHPIKIWDSTLREGEQPPAVVFTPEEKLEIAHALDEFGVHWSSVGFPAVSRQEQETVSRIARAGLRMKTAALARLVNTDIDIAADTGVDLVAIFLGASDTHLRDKLQITEAQAIDKVESAIRRVKERGAQFSFTIEDGTRTPLPRIIRLFQLAADAGADHVNLADTAGILTPSATARIVTIIKALIPCPLSLHFHDDLGLALGNLLAGLEAGAEIAQVTVNGAGERSGNTCTEELAVVLKVKYGVDLGLKLDKIVNLCNLVHRASNTKPSEHKSVTGKWCFSHESGIHVAGVLANPECYQAYAPEMIGRQHEIVFGKHSGEQSVAYLAQKVGANLSDSGRRAVLEKIKTAAQRKEEHVSVEQVIEWIRSQ